MMAGRNRDDIAALEAERLVREQEIKSLPVDPIAIAESLGILVEPKLTRGGVSGMLVRVGNEFGIAYATHIESEGFKCFCIAHELGHYRIPGHIDAVLAHGDIHESHAGFAKDDVYERQADHFAASLLMPDDLFAREMRLLGDGLQAIEVLAERCITSLPATAIRYVQKVEVPVAMVVSTGPCIDYCFMSASMQEFGHLDWPRKGERLPRGSETDGFNSEPGNIRESRRGEAEIDLRIWFGGRREIPGTEEVVGLGGYGKTLTILCSEMSNEDEDEEYELEENWRPSFRR